MTLTSGPPAFTSIMSGLQAWGITFDFCFPNMLKLFYYWQIFGLSQVFGSLNIAISPKCHLLEILFLSWQHSEEGLLWRFNHWIYVLENNVKCQISPLSSHLFHTMKGSSLFYHMHLPWCSSLPQTQNSRANKPQMGTTKNVRQSKQFLFVS